MSRHEVPHRLVDGWFSHPMQAGKRSTASAGLRGSAEAAQIASLGRTAGGFTPRLVYAGNTSHLDCGGAFYDLVAGGVRATLFWIEATVSGLPSGPVDGGTDGTTYFTYGGAYYRPFHRDGSGVIYPMVTKAN